MTTSATATARDSMLNRLRRRIREHTHTDEASEVEELLQLVGSENQQTILKNTTELVRAIRAKDENHGGLDAFLQEYSLSSEEGVALMCLAESLLRVPDAETADALLADKLAGANWRSHLGHSDSFFVNASTWGLLLTGSLISLDKETIRNPTDFFSRLISRSGEPLVRLAVGRAMKIMGSQFVLAENIDGALKAAAKLEAKGFLYSYDMLGEAARTAVAAEHYYHAYKNAIGAIGARARKDSPEHNPGISVKLSALHPRYEPANMKRILSELYPRLRSLCLLAHENRIGLTIDAEEAARLDPSLSLLQLLCAEPALKQWQGLGFVVQAYQKRARYVIDWLAELAARHSRRLMVRLVKGAYWDTEIKHAQEEGYADYPVFTRKLATDVSYLHCARRLLAQSSLFYPLFATHNAHTVASVIQFAGKRRDFEFQCLYGMGERLYEELYGELYEGLGAEYKCRIYAPVGPHKDLLAYLVRRLLENGANSSFVNRLVDRKLPIEKIVQDPVAQLNRAESKPHPSIPRPPYIYGERKNAIGFNLDCPLQLESYYETSAQVYRQSFRILPRTTAGKAKAKAQPLFSPADDSVIGSVTEAEDVATAAQVAIEAQPLFSPADDSVIGSVTETEDVATAAQAAIKAQPSWDEKGGKHRARILRRAADLFEHNRFHLMALCQREAGKTLKDAVGELREAVDFLRYYAAQAERDFSAPVPLPGPTGESNLLSLHGRGAFVCISPWNFPLAIFTGQVSAALAAGNAVLAKPAEQTPILADRAVSLLHQAGVPEPLLHCLPGAGDRVGSQLVAHPQIAGVAFTGSTEVAKRIQQALAAKPGPVVPLIAETGGINAMIADSTALPEQVTDDVIRSAFHSAGQRCSALRVLYLQEGIADSVTEMLKGAMEELVIGDPRQIETDLGPLIDKDALRSLQEHIRSHSSCWQPKTALPSSGSYLLPTLIEIGGIEELQRESFGPVLHIARYAGSKLNEVLERINACGYGLTFGIHSRIQTRAEDIAKRIKAGNIYINRNIIGATVGAQPFGGEGLSGTGPKAGGPNYLKQFATERSLCINQTAAGGNTELLGISGV